MSSTRKPDLDQLITALTANGHPEERTGRDSALAAFRAAHQPDAVRRMTGPGRGAPFRRPFTVLPGRVTAVAVAAGVVVAVAVAGITAAAYTQTLPASMQQIAHTVFAPLGVPNGQPAQLGHPATVTIATSGATSLPGAEYRISVAVSRTRVQANGRVAFTGRVTVHGRAAAEARVRLFERLAGSTQFKLVASGVTGPLGGFRLASPPLTATSVFRVAGPDSARSAALRVTVAAPEVTAGVADAAPGPAPTVR